MKQHRDRFTLGQVARLLSLSRRKVENDAEAGRLLAHHMPGRTWRYVTRAELVRWLVAGGVPPEYVRGVLNRDGAAVLVGCHPDIQVALGGSGTVAVPSLFRLGEVITRQPAWVVVVDLEAVGATEAGGALADFAGRVDRPALVGLYGDAGTPVAALSTFDVLLSRASPAAALARSIRYTKPSPRTRDL